MMPPRLRKLMLTVHVTASVGWLGAIVAYIALNVPALTSDAEQTVRGAYLMMDVVLRWALIPLAATALATGIVQALGTPWGLLRHYWVTISLAVTTFAFVILVLHLPAVEDLAAIAADPQSDVANLGGDLFHSVGGLIVLLVPLTLNMYKPRGLTRYGWRRSRNQDLSTRRSRRGHTVSRMLLFAVLLVGAGILTACGTGEDTPASETHTALNGDEFNDADVGFATDTIQHHAQALSMVDMTLGRQLDPHVQQLAEDIRATQGPEIEQLTEWLRDWDQPIPETVRDHSNAHGGGDVAMDADMPGMMSAEEMQELEVAEGEEFENMWLEMMIEHHAGAIEMAQAEQSAGSFRPAITLAETIESTQRQGISTMQDLLGA